MKTLLTLRCLILKLITGSSCQIRKVLIVAWQPHETERPYCFDFNTHEWANTSIPDYLGHFSGNTQFVGHKFYGCYYNTVAALVPLKEEEVEDFNTPFPSDGFIEGCYVLGSVYFSCLLFVRFFITIFSFRIYIPYPYEYFSCFLGLNNAWLVFINPQNTWFVQQGYPESRVNRSASKKMSKHAFRLPRSLSIL